MTETKNSTRKNFWILGIVVGLISIFVFVQAQMNSAISNHPKVVEIGITQGHIKAQHNELKVLLREINYKIEVLDRKVTKLSVEEYP